jgi:hypothetical protein
VTADNVGYILPIAAAAPQANNGFIDDGTEEGAVARCRR